MVAHQILVTWISQKLTMTIVESEFWVHECESKSRTVKVCQRSVDFKNRWSLRAYLKALWSRWCKNQVDWNDKLLCKRLMFIRSVSIISSVKLIKIRTYLLPLYSKALRNSFTWDTLLASKLNRMSLGSSVTKQADKRLMTKAISRRIFIFGFADRDLRLRKKWIFYYSKPLRFLKWRSRSFLQCIINMSWFLSGLAIRSQFDAAIRRHYILAILRRW